jgi:hypothetical protein
MLATVLSQSAEFSSLPATFSLCATQSPINHPHDFTAIHPSLPVNNRAVSMFYNDRPGWEALVRRIMQQDWSWYAPALDYCELYYKALQG